MSLRALMLIYAWHTGVNLVDIETRSMSDVREGGMAHCT